MQTLGVSDSTPRTEGRIKSLFWPSIQSGADVDYLAVQGYWVCTIIAAMSLVGLIVMGQPITAFAVFLLFHVGGAGVREHSRFAATVIFVYYVVDLVASMTSLGGYSGFSIVRFIFLGLLLSNLRATWLAAAWQSSADQATLPPRLAETLRDKFVDRWPAWLWPKIRVVYYIFSLGFLAIVALGLIMIATGRTHV